MKVAILTLTGDNNYGNKLQNYAVQYQLKKIGCEPTTIRICEERYRLKMMLVIIMSPIVSLIEKYKDKIKRKLCFWNFNKLINQDFKNISSVDIELVKTKLLEYDKIIYGSDQIWNSEMKSFSEIYLGYCASKEKNIALCASFGKENIDEKYMELFSNGLQNFEYVSVRESVGKKLAKQIANIDAVILPDPTLTVPISDWVKMEHTVKVPDKYVLTYFLGKEPIDELNKIANDKNLKIINANISQPYGPAEFLYLIHHASLICTDSFHACVFSILYKKSFCVFSRDDDYQKMNSRIDTLFNTLEIRTKKLHGYSVINEDEVNWIKINMIIKRERDRFTHYLNTALYKNIT